MDGIEGSEVSGRQDARRAQDSIVDPNEVDTSKDLLATPDRGLSQRHECPGYFGSSKRARDQRTPTPEIAAECVRFRLANRELHERG